MDDRNKTFENTVTDHRFKAQGTQVLGRAIEVLKTVARLQRSGATLAAITRSTGFNRSTAFRIVQFLTDVGMLGYDGEQGAYYIGSLAFELGLAARDQAEIAGRWSKKIEHISKLTRMTTYLTARSDLEVVCLAVVEAQSVLRTVSLSPGERLPLGVGAGSLAILSALDDNEVNTLIKLNAPRLRMHSESTLTPEMLWQRVERTRRDGYAYSADSVAKGVAGVGIALKGTHELTQLALSVSATPSDFDPPRRHEIARLIDDIAQSE